MSCAVVPGTELASHQARTTEVVENVSCSVGDSSVLMALLYEPHQCGDVPDKVWVLP
jgi:hypothetical protein